MVAPTSATTRPIYPCGNEISRSHKIAYWWSFDILSILIFAVSLSPVVAHFEYRITAPYRSVLLDTFQNIIEPLVGIARCVTAFGWRRAAAQN
jgi:hypothetical protein